MAMDKSDCLILCKCIIILDAAYLEGFLGCSSTPVCMQLNNSSQHGQQISINLLAKQQNDNWSCQLSDLA